MLLFPKNNYLEFQYQLHPENMVHFIGTINLEIGMSINGKKRFLFEKSFLQRNTQNVYFFKEKCLGTKIKILADLFLETHTL